MVLKLSKLMCISGNQVEYSTYGFNSQYRLKLILQ